jgi:NhaP-type Na+/H+ or K+/H+ antiporter
MTFVVVFVCLVFAYALVSGRIGRGVVTAPIVFTAAGMAGALVLPDLRQTPLSRDLWLGVAEAGLVLLLFTDASRTDLKLLNSIRSLPARLLGVGMPLTMVIGALCALAVFPSISIWEAAILGAILAPTDAGLGQIIVSSPRVPMCMREALNVEAGLNDGLSVPFMLFFIALAASGAAGPEASLVHYAVEQLGYGTLIGLGIGLAGGRLLRTAHRRHWLAHAWKPLGVVALPVLCALASAATGASMFIAAFVAGLAVHTRHPEAGQHAVEFTEGSGQLFNLAVFFFFGTQIVHAWSAFRPEHLLYAILSLTLVRMLPVAISLAGTGLSRASLVFAGWFGPRGLASIVLGLVYLELDARLPGESTIRLTVILTVAISIFAHGLSARPGIDGYARSVGRLPAGAPEKEA